MAQEEMEAVNVVYCAKCSMPVEYCRYSDKDTYKSCLQWLKQKKQKDILEYLLSVDDELAGDLEKLSLEEEKLSEQKESTNEPQQPDTNDTSNDPEEKSPHDPTKKPSKSILKQDETDETNNNDDDEDDEDDNNNNNNDNNEENSDEDGNDNDDPLLSQNFNRAIGMGRNVGRGGKGRRQKGRKGGRKKGRKGGNDDSDSDDNSNLSAKQLKEKQRQKRREELAKDAMQTEEEKNEQEKAQKAQKREKMKADAELLANKKIIVIESKKIKGGKVVTLVTGLVELGMKPKRAQSEFRKQFATGVGVNVNDQGKTEVVIQGEHRYDLMKFLREKFNTPAKLLYYRLRSGLEPGFSPEGMQFPPGM